MELSSDIRIFAVATLSFALIALLYPVSLAWKLSKTPKDRARWLKNTPTFSIYLPFVFSMAFGLLLAGMPTQQILGLKAVPLTLSLVLLGVLAGLATFAVFEDLKRPLVEPFMLREHDAALGEEIRVRDRLERQTTDSIRQRETESYRSVAKPLGSLRGLKERGSAIAWASFVLNLLSALTIALLFWLLVLVTLYDKVSVDFKELSLMIALFCLFFPLRFYAEWYLNFRSLAHLSRYSALWFLLLAAIFSYIYLVFQRAGDVIKIFSSASAALVAVVAFLARFKPEWLGLVARILDDMPPRWFAACASLAVITLIAMVVSLVRDLI